ncbi:MAG TPA: J domain-containing protein, partial [Acidobacteriota bacterium]|nr:J domain-containing protein [Acidobacteriota bacterium]
TADWSLFSLSPGTSAVDLKRAYRDLIDVWHPDRFAHNPRLQAKAEAMTKRINAAYQRLQVAA